MDPTPEAIVQHDFDHEAVHELLFLINDQVSDGDVSDDETRSLRVWLRDNPDVAVIGPGRRVAERSRSALGYIEPAVHYSCDEEKHKRAA